jgi:hypothetical protein
MSDTFEFPLNVPPPIHETSITGFPGSGILKPALDPNVVKTRSPTEAVTLSGVRLEAGFVGIDIDIDIDLDELF